MNEKTILCYGDSLTWGWVPGADVVPTTRYPANVRWTGVLAAALGSGHAVIEEGLSGRTTNLDDPVDPRLNGATYLPSCLATHLPLDLVVLMLGTNDTKAYFQRTATDIAVGMSSLLSLIAASVGGVGTEYPAPQVLVVAPPPLGTIPNPWLASQFDGAREKTAGLADVYRILADFHNVSFFDAGTVIRTEGIDGVHFSQENNRRFGTAISSEVQKILAPPV